MSVAQIFESFCELLALAQSLRSSISTRTGRIVGRLNNDFRSLSSDTANRFYAGSDGRDTAAQDALKYQGAEKDCSRGRRFLNSCDPFAVSQ
jgi:hypothetical protein